MTRRRITAHVTSRIRIAALLTVAACVIAVSTTVPSAQSRAQTPSWMDPTLSPQERADLLLAEMTLDEKIAMVHGAPGVYTGNIPANTRLGIPSINMQDGPVGIARMPQVTALPAPIALAASWDTEMAQQYGTLIGEEAQSKGVNVLLGPMINIVRAPQAGRNFEGFGEDPYLSAAIAVAEIEALQGLGVIATPKHYVNNEQEHGRGQGSSQVDERTRHEIYLQPFRAAIEADAGAVMCAYNKIDDVYACENDHVLNEILKDELGFQGWVMSDWGATHSTVAAALGGLDMEMPGGEVTDGIFFGTQLKEAIESGAVPAERLDDMVRRVLIPMFQMGLFDNPMTGKHYSAARTDAHVQTAREIAAQGTVLLKNEDVLPLDPASLTSIVVIGTAAGKEPLSVGGGSAEVISAMVVPPLEGITERAGSGVPVDYAQGDDGASIDEAVQLAEQSDVAIVFVGVYSSEGWDRETLVLPEGQDELVRRIAAVNPRTVVVMNVPAQVLMPWTDEVPAILVAWYPGQENGNAIASVLFGDTNPAARLPVTFVNNTSELPTVDVNEPMGNPVHYDEGLLVGYRWYNANDVEPLFPFGHGLSYTTFDYAHLALTGPAEGQVQVALDVANTGSRAGAEVVQLYVDFPPGLGEPPGQLKGFQKLYLDVGETEVLTFTLTADELSYWDTSISGWTVPTGTFQIDVGASSRDIRLGGSFDVINPDLSAPLTAQPDTTDPDAAQPDAAPPTATYLLGLAGLLILVAVGMLIIRRKKGQSQDQGDSRTA